MRRAVWIGAMILAGVVLLVQAGPRIIERILQGPRPVQGHTDIQFRELPTPFVHRSDFDKALPFMALAAIDIDGDGIDEIFAGGGLEQQDALLRYTEAGLQTSTFGRGLEKSLPDATYGAAAIDATGDGRTDLFVARHSGLYFYQNTDDGFTGTRLQILFSARSLPLSVALGDLNHDGAVDLYLSNYIRPEFFEGQTIFNRPYGATNLLLLNNGDNTFRDITDAAGISHQHNTFVSIFADLDNDGDAELVLAHDTGMPTIYRNNGDLTFTEVPLPVTFSFPMGIAVSDYNGDGLLDLYFSNTGHTLPLPLIRGDLGDDQTLNTDYILLENQGNLQFVDVATAHQAANFGFGWGVVSFDFNNDTRPDYLITQNYVRFPGVRFLPLYAGHLLQQDTAGIFHPVEEQAQIENKEFGVTAVVTDFNRDGWPDVVIGNLDGPLRAFINQGGARHWLSVHLPNQPSSLNARLTLDLADGTVLTQQVIAGEGLGSDQTRTVFFGLGDQSVIVSLTIVYADGRVRTVDAPAIDQMVIIDE